MNVITNGSVLFVFGFLLALGAFAFATRNMYGGITSDDNSSTGTFVGDHYGAIVAMTLGGAASAIGIVLLIIGLVLKFTA